MSRPRKVLEAWKHTEPAVTRFGTVRRYYLHCQVCFQPKGHSVRKLCASCARKGPRVIGLRLECKSCGEVHFRDDVIRALYMAGGASTDIGKLFNLSANQVLNIANKKPQ